MSHVEPDAATHVLTRTVHAGREQLRSLGVHTPPLDRSTTYPLTSLDGGTESLDQLAGGARIADNPVYQRLHNPTVARWEDAIAGLEHAEAAVAFSSGMAAITATVMAARLRGGDHVVAVRPIYGGTDHLLATGLLGGSVTWARPDEVAEAIRPDTGLVLLETPANPTLATVDIARVVAQAAGVPVAVDNTFATPILQNPLDHGAAYAIHSATKALGGHGDVTGGVVACSESLAQPLRQVRILTGALLDPQAAWLLHRGLPTLALRVNAAQDGACTLAQRLALHPDVIDVRHPSLPGQDPLDLVPRQMAGPGQMIAFRVRGGYARAARIVAAVDLITPAVSLGSVDTLIQHPAGLTHRVVDAGARDAHGIGDDLLRLSVGIEHPDDLWHDLTRALAVSAPADRPLETASR
ncbi:trans-sulfuration enzyme family protein [Euzebya rosea]|uniref:trans-sulfuration enzyme family protein n=1 Tax=Euzebya rosea TaxID=2052804 RepID=UPI000D3EA53A|nr:PLP-dependent transferase [Euzebya rosea]